MLQMRINSIKAWERRDSPAWPPLRKLQELIRHFRLGDLITRLHERAGQCHWTMQLSEGPVNLIGEASGRECSAVKDKAAVDLIDNIQVEFGFYDNPVRNMELETDLTALRIERLAIDRPVEIICNLCNEFVVEADFPNHTNRCYYNRVTQLTNQLRTVQEEADEEATNIRAELERVRQSAYRCLVCFEETHEIRDPNWLGTLPCGHLICTHCYDRLIQGAASHRRECPTCRRSIKMRPIKIFN